MESKQNTDPEPDPRNWDPVQPHPSFRDPVNPAPGFQPQIINIVTKKLNDQETTTEKAMLPANLQLSINDSIIGTQLTPHQKHWLNQSVQELLKGPCSYSAETLALGIELTLLDKMSFTKAGDIFLKKLNAIVKTIRCGYWLPPKPPEFEQDPIYRTHLDNMRQIICEINHWRKIKEFKKQPLNDMEQASLQQHEKLLFKIREEINACKSAYNLKWQDYVEQSRFKQGEYINEKTTN